MRCRFGNRRHSRFGNLRYAIQGAGGAFALVCLLFAALGIKAQSPLSPSDEAKKFQLADANLQIQLVASEPAVVAPVAVAWDADARMFVAEMTDYPSGPVSGRIRLLEDRDGDGLYERSTIFATNLAFPNGVMPWRNGVLVTAAPDIWFLADTNGDGVADVRERVLTGFAEGNQQLRVNGLFWGVDNWIYGANGRSDGEVRWADGSPAGSIRRHDFRFRPDTKQFEPVAGNSQFGMGHDDWGNRFPVFNNIPIRHVVMEDRYLAAQPLVAGADVVPSISPTEDGNRVFAVTPPALLIPQPVGFFTSACGPSIYRGTALPDSYRGNYFVCEPVQNVVQRRVLIPSGSTFVARYAHTNREFLASSDPWFHGVFTATGPDGALYVVDFYREWVEHPHWVAPELRDKIDWRRGEEHGRIWRIFAKGAKLAKPALLSRASDKQLVQALESSKGWVRDTAQRLLFERNATNTATLLERLARGGGDPRGRLAALSLLETLGALSPGMLLRALNDKSSRVREDAVRLAENLIAGDKTRAQDEIRGKLRSLCTDSDARVRLQLAAALREWHDPAMELDILAQVASHPGLDEWQAMAILANVGERPWLLLSRLRSLLDVGTEAQQLLLGKLAAFTVKGENTNDTQSLATWLTASKSQNRLLLAASLAEAMGPRNPATVSAMFGGDDLLNAATAAVSSPAPLRIRLGAVRFLAASHARVSFAALLDRNEPEPLQGAVAKAMCESDDPTLAKQAFERWPACSKAAHRQMIASSVRHPGSALVLLEMVEAKTIPLWEIDPTSRQALQKSSDTAVQQRATALLQTAPSSDRESIVKKYAGAAQTEGDRKRGASVFERTCLVCHPMQGVGAKVGPDLSGIGTHSKETLLVDILDPSRQVLPDFISYTATAKTGETVTGFIANESASTVTLRRPNEPDITFQRAELAELKTENRSLMPDGLESGITLEEMADLLEFLRRPDRTFFGSAAELGKLK